GVARRLVEVDDYRIERAFRIELAAEAADHLLICPDVTEGLPGRKWLLFGDLDPRYARLRARGRGDEGEAGTPQQQQAFHRRSSKCGMITSSPWEFHGLPPMATTKLSQ